MATIEPRNRADGTTAYRPKWRYGGNRNGPPQGLTYDDLDDAKSMKGAVGALRHLVYDDDPKVLTFELVTGQKPVTFSGRRWNRRRRSTSLVGRGRRSTQRGYRHAVRRVPSLLASAIDGTGQRISEALGLVVADVHVDDFDAAWIDVELQLSRRNSAGAVLERIPLKTYASQGPS